MLQVFHRAHFACCICQIFFRIFDEGGQIKFAFFSVFWNFNELLYVLSFFSAHSYCFQRNYVLLFFFGTPLQYSCLEKPMDRGAWWAVVHGVPKSQTWLSDFVFTHWRRKWQPTPVFSPGESQGRGSLVGCRLWGCTEWDTTEAT